MRITVPEMRQRLYPIRGGMNEYVKSKSCEVINSCLSGWGKAFYLAVKS